ncbi:MAG: HipA domain-containing protein [Polyangiales bacterium]|nr:type II toxin-antitoxin system HipA family toxin [Myxococcales bacterium]MCB9656828.1 type II toxin-antitoxin system HipA family toxin [Sandaracinaceae bacterium]
MTSLAEVRLWGSRIGAVALEDGERVTTFAYDPDFARSGIQVAPLMMPLRPGPFRFPELDARSFHGLPGLLAEALPDKYGNTLIDAWLATQGRHPESFNAVERLCYTGVRGMGALEFAPALGPRQGSPSAVQIDALVALASEVLSQRDELRTSFADPDKADSLRDLLRVGTSAGGARAKAVIAWNETTGEVRSGQVGVDPGFTHWLLKFDGVANNRDKELADPSGYGAVEYAYASMARAAGVHMSECRLLEEGGRRHFMTRRFDRRDDGSKLHMQSLAAMAHLDFNDPHAHSYEQALLVMRQLALPMPELEQQLRRMVFNLVARNQDDHVKNIAFLMDKRGSWRLSPAFDVTWSYNPAGDWTARHQMSVNGKRDDFTVDDILACAKSASIPVRRARKVVQEVSATVARWREFAADARVAPAWREAIASTLRLELR